MAALRSIKSVGRTDPAQPRPVPPVLPRYAAAAARRRGETPPPLPRAFSAARPVPLEPAAARPPEAAAAVRPPVLEPPPPAVAVAGCVLSLPGEKQTAAAPGVQRKDCPDDEPSVSVLPALGVMPDERKVRNKVLLRLLGHPVVLVPAVLGFSAGTWFWAFAGRPAFGVFAALAGFLTAGGAYLTRVIFDQGRTAGRVLTELELRQREVWESRLDALDRRLVQADQDPRPESALRDLRALLRAFEQVAQQCGDDHLAAVLEVRSRVQQLFEQSVHALEQTMRLYATARQLHLPAARDPILAERERILADIQAGISKLGATLVALQRLGAGFQARGELTRLRDALDDSLQLAHRVEQRLHDLLDDQPFSPDGPNLRRDTPQPLKGD